MNFHTDLNFVFLSVVPFSFPINHISGLFITIRLIDAALTFVKAIQLKGMKMYAPAFMLKMNPDRKHPGDNISLTQTIRRKYPLKHFVIGFLKQFNDDDTIRLHFDLWIYYYLFSC